MDYSLIIPLGRRGNSVKGLGFTIQLGMYCFLDTLLLLDRSEVVRTKRDSKGEFRFLI